MDSIFLIVIVGIIYLLVFLAVLHIYWNTVKLVYKNLGGGAAFVVGLTFLGCMSSCNKLNTPPPLHKSGLVSQDKVKISGAMKNVVLAENWFGNLSVQIYYGKKEGKSVPYEVNAIFSGLTIADNLKVTGIDLAPLSKANHYRMALWMQKSYAGLGVFYTDTNMIEQVKEIYLP